VLFARVSLEKLLRNAKGPHGKLARSIRSPLPASPFALRVLPGWTCVERPRCGNAGIPTFQCFRGFWILAVVVYSRQLRRKRVRGYIQLLPLAVTQRGHRIPWEKLAPLRYS
jgi:hypothetical protein